MKPLAHHIRTVREQPEHIRKQVAFTVAFGLATLVALVWLIGSLSMGSFALHPTSFAEATAADSSVKTATAPKQNSLLGAVSAAFLGSSTPAHIEIVNAPAPQTAPAHTADTRTVISF